jgi:hypothetical protein
VNVPTISPLNLILVQEKELELPHVYDRPYSSKIFAGFKASEAQPREFAIGLTIMAWDMYSALLKSDFISWLDKLPGQEYVQNHIRIWDKLNLWARKMMLDPEHEKTRTNRITLFISIAIVSIDSLVCQQTPTPFLRSVIGSRTTSACRR